MLFRLIEPQCDNQVERIRGATKHSRFERPRSRRMLFQSAIICSALIALYATLTVSQRHELSQYDNLINPGAQPPTRDSVKVKIAYPQRGSATANLTLPGELQSDQEADIFSRASGYLKRLTVDLGSKVNGGDLLAEVESPEDDAQFAEVKANLERAKANLDISQRNYERQSDLKRRNVGSQQELDATKAAFLANLAVMSANEASVQRLSAQEAFHRIVAPFAGTITARNLQVGALVTSDSSNWAQAPILRLSKTDILRVRVNVPQAYSFSAVPGLPAQISVAEMPGKVFMGTVARTSGAIDPTSRTLLVEIALSNHDCALLPGAFVQVSLQVARLQAPLLIPAECLISNAAGQCVAVVEPASDKVKLRNVELGCDYGDKVEILSGLISNEAVILHPPDSLQDGEEVTPVRNL
jgi:RND family efflux transporter MFP subunit